MNRATRMQRFDLSDLYVVITEEFCGGRSAMDVLDAVLDAGVTLVQLREKSVPSQAFYERAKEFRTRIDAAGALLIINDRLDVALAVDADGVHLGQDDLPIQVARRLAPEIIVGASTHNVSEAVAAQAAGADYANIGPIFSTQTKAVKIGPVGPEMIDAITPHLTIRCSCMGGIKLHNIEQVLRRGVRHPAVVTAVTEAVDVRAAAAELRRAVLRFRS